jgi:hypothetical protein
VLKSPDGQLAEYFREAHILPMCELELELTQTQAHTYDTTKASAMKLVASERAQVRDM